MINIVLDSDDNILTQLFSGKDCNVYIRSINDACDTEDCHVVILTDIGFSSSDMQIIEQIRTFSAVPVMVMTREHDEMYTLMALSKGADMVVSRNDTGDNELFARIVALARRCPSDMAAAKAEEEIIENGIITIDRQSRCVYKNSRNIKMTSTEYGIVECLMKNAGNVCSTEAIYSYVWHEEPYLVNKTITEYVRRIRAKLEQDPHAPKLIKTVSGVGYFMVKAG